MEVANPRTHLLSTLTISLICASNLLVAASTVFTLQNRCPYTVWPATLSGNGVAMFGGEGFLLRSGASASLEALAGWTGRFWARTWCVFDSSGGSGNCTTGDCGGALRCTVSGAPPVSLVEFTLGGGQDYYDVSLVNGYNVGVGVAPVGSSDGEANRCKYAGCVADLNAVCPAELRVGGDSGETVACRSACAAFGADAYCCTGTHASPTTCGPSRYSKMFKSACPAAYSYAFDNASSACTCPAGSDYLITFCPS